MAIVKLNKNVHSVDLDSTCGNYEKYTDFYDPDTLTTVSTYTPMPVRATAVNAAINYINSVAFSNPRFLMGCGGALDGSYTSGQPFFKFKYPNLSKNVWGLRFKVLFLPAASENGSAYVERYNDSDTATAGQIYTGVDGAGYTFPEGLKYVEFEYDKTGFTAGTSEEDGLSTYGDIRVIDFVVEEIPPSAGDTDSHDVIEPLPIYAGSEITTKHLGDIQSVQHEVRSTNLGIIACYSSRATSGTWQTPGSSDETALVTTSTSFVNIFDSSVTSRTATSQGVLSNARYRGVGLDGTTQGRKVFVRGEVLAYCTTNDGEVKIIGPDHVGSNDDTVTITSGGSASWYSFSTGILLDAESSYTSDTTTGRNKIDIHFRMTGAGTLYLYAYNLWVEYS